MSSFVCTSLKKALSGPQGLRNKELLRATTSQLCTYSTKGNWKGKLDSPDEGLPKNDSAGQQAVDQTTTSTGKGPISWFSRFSTALGFSHGDPSSRHSDMLEKRAANIRKRVEVLKDIQSECDEFEAEYFKERAALEAKYHKLCELLYTKRYEIVNGEVEVEGVTKEDNDSDDFGIPDFWLTALKTDDTLAKEITELDEGALKYLKDIKWYRVDDPKGFKLEFHFDTNPYFKNPLLTKTYHVSDKDEFFHEKAIGTEIEWYPRKCLTHKILNRKGKRGTKTETRESFFNFFSDEEALQDQDQMTRDYDIGWTIRSEIIPHAVSWYTGEAAKRGEFHGADEDEDNKDKEADDEEEDKEEIEEDEEGEEEDVEDEEDEKEKKCA